METLEVVKDKKTAETNLEELYESAFPAVASFVKTAGGNLDDAKDIFHDAMVVYFEVKSREALLNPKAYLVGIARHLWNRKFRNTRRMVPLSELEQQIQVPEDFYVSVKTQKLVTFLERAGKKCMDLLRAFYFRKQHLNSLVKNMGFSNEHSASVQKYKCLEKLRDMVKQKSLAYEDFVE